MNEETAVALNVFRDTLRFLLSSRYDVVDGRSIKVAGDYDELDKLRTLNSELDQLTIGEKDE